MKKAISLPDDLFAEAERLARETKKSRSQIVREALTEYRSKFPFWRDADAFELG